MQSPSLSLTVEPKGVLEPPPAVGADVTLEEPNPDDLEEAEAIACGVSMKLPEKRHLVALLNALQLARIAREEAKDLASAALEGMTTMAQRARDAVEFRIPAARS